MVRQKLSTEELEKMKYNTAIEKERDEAFEYLTKLSASDSLVEILKVSPRRSLKQNAYLHLLCGAFGDHFGYSLEEAKMVYKEINKNIYYYKKKERVFVRSSADLTIDEMKESIDRFRQKSAEQGCDLPLATDADWLRSIENKIEQNKYLGG